MFRLDRYLALDFYGRAPIAKEKYFDVLDGKSHRDAFTGDRRVLIDKVLQSDSCFSGTEAVNEDAIVGEMFPIRFNVAAVDFFAA